MHRQTQNLFLKYRIHNMLPMILIVGIYKATNSTHLPARCGPHQPSGCWEMGDRNVGKILEKLYLLYEIRTMWPIILISKVPKGTNNTHLPVGFGPNRPSSCWEMRDWEKNSDIRTALFIWCCKWLVILIFKIRTSAWCIQPHANSRQNRPSDYWENGIQNGTDARTHGWADGRMHKAILI